MLLNLLYQNLNTMRRITDCLDKQLRDLCQQADHLNSKIGHYLPDPLRVYCRVSRFNNNSLVLTVDNAAWATELRYYLPELRDRLRKEAGLYQLISIKIEISPADTTYIAKATTTTSSLSPAAKETIRHASISCTYDPLKKALLKLASHHHCDPSLDGGRSNLDACFVKT